MPHHFFILNSFNFLNNCGYVANGCTDICKRVPGNGNVTANHNGSIVNFTFNKLSYFILLPNNVGSIFSNQQFWEDLDCYSASHN